ncbi:hypothetical protein K435DRAFT_849600 [Dendrothele bispora CBS 962.96]|uniref:Uncharacterized protein n=1 Tax=Dendrothele bispora (strain CBS 962.96) TaxID=1314807 RepID=A0A4V4HIA6_DENBC|nr:hypothetical protein K435DRAFT_849600 [Dendrothele bispora CBS 962.96]
MAYIQIHNRGPCRYACSRSERLEEEKTTPTTPITYFSQITAREYLYIVQNFVIDNGNGTLGYNGTVSVVQFEFNRVLGGERMVFDSPAHVLQDDLLTLHYDSAYNVTRPISYNSVLSSAAFVLASLEYEKSSEQ